MFGKAKLRTIIVLSLLMVGLIPATIIAMLALRSGGRELERDAYDKLAALHDVKGRQVNEYFKGRREEMGRLVDTTKTIWFEVFEKLVAVKRNKKAQVEMYVDSRMNLMTDVQRNPRFTEGIVALTEASRHGSDSPEYAAIFKERVSGLQEFCGLFGFPELFLIDASGKVVFSLGRDAEWDTDLVSGPFKDTVLAKAYENARTRASFTDYELFGPSNEPVSFLSTPLFASDGKLIGVAAFQLSITDLDTIMADRGGLGETGETFLVGPDYLMRTNAYRDPLNHSVLASHRNPSKGMIDTKASRSALAGTASADVIVDYNGDYVLCSWIPVRIGEITWALMAKMDLEEAFSSKTQAAGTDFLARFKTKVGDTDLLLLEPDGFSFHTTAHRSDYQTNLLNGRYKDSNLGRLVRQVVQTKSFGFADFEPYEPCNNEPTAFVARPVVDNEGEIQLIAAMELPVEAINEIMVSRVGMGETGGTYVVGPDHLMRSDGYLDHAPASVIDSFSSRQRVETTAITHALEGKSGQEVITVTASGIAQNILSNYAPIDVYGTRWVLLSEINQAEALASVSSLRSFMILTVSVTVVAIIVLALAIARMIRRKLAIETGQLQTASSQLKSASQQQMSGASEQTAATGQVSTTMDELAATARQIAERCQQVSQLADSAAARCQESSEAVQEGQTITDEIRNQIDKIVQHMTDLGAKTQEINMAVEVITELSEQTTILSYNAAIEAASAGEAGQTFSVVADQVGKLADRAKQAAKDVRGVVDEIQKSTSTTIMTTEDGMKAAERGLATQDQASKRMMAVADEIRSTLDAAREIEMASKQQSTAAAQVKEGIEQVIGAAKESEASAKQTLGTADILVSTANNLDNI